jgi:predicted PurR-regulated permease PerM
VLVITCLYVIAGLLVLWASFAFLPKLLEQLQAVFSTVERFDDESFYDLLGPDVGRLIQVHVDLDSYVTELGAKIAQALTKVTSVGITVCLSVLLSFIILMEQRKLKIFADTASMSRSGYVFDYLFHFGRNFAVTFGKVMKVQCTIAAINCVISIVILALLGFPNVLGLGFMIFVLGLVPIAGAITSLVPLSVVAYNLGGPPKVVLVLLLIVFLHALETYIMNPKLMSMRTELPVCFVFVILILSEHYLGIWGLLIGVPLFVFLVDEAGIPYGEAMKEEHRRQKEARRAKCRRKRGEAEALPAETEQETPRAREADPLDVDLSFEAEDKDEE